MARTDRVPEKPFISHDQPEREWCLQSRRKHGTGNHGEPANLGDYVHIQQSFSREGDPQIIQIERNRIHRKIFSPGDEIEIAGQVYNPEDYPLFDMQLYANLFLMEEGVRKSKRFGQNLIQDLLLWKSENIAARGKKGFRYLLKVPEFSVSGTYGLSLNLCQNRRFPIRGNSYYWDGLSEWYNPLGATVFKVVSRNKDSVFIDRSSVRYKCGSESKKVDFLLEPYAKKVAAIYLDYPDLEISFDIQNMGNSAEDVLVSYDLMRPRLDSFNRGGRFAKFLDRNWRKRIEKEWVSIEPGITKTVSRRIIFGERSEQADFILAVDAISSKSKSMLHLFVVTSRGINSSSFVWPGIDAFPVVKGQTFTLWTGFMTQSRMKSRASVNVRLLDRMGRVVGQLEYGGIVDGKIRAWKKLIKANRDYSYFKMVGRITDQHGNLLDSFEKTYDQSLLLSLR